MKKIQFKRMMVAAGLCALGTVAHAEGSASAFDPAAASASMVTVVTAVGVGVGALLTAAIVVWGGFMAYRFFRTAISKA